MGIEIHSVVFGFVTNDIMKNEEKHYVTIFMLARSDDEPTNMEPHKCDGWNAYTWDELLRRIDDEETLFGPLRQLLLEQPTNVLEYLQREH